MFLTGHKEQRELDRLRLLESAFDPQPRQRLENVGIIDGWHCLEVGAGAGSIMNRMKVLYERIRTALGEFFYDLARQKECKILEGHLQPDHVHMLVSIPSRYSVAQMVGFMKGKSAIHVARVYLGQRKNYNGMHFGARGYHVSTVGVGEEVVRFYLRHQEEEGKQLDRLEGTSET